VEDEAIILIELRTTTNRVFRQAKVGVTAVSRRPAIVGTNMSDATIAPRRLWRS
jgi:hypothetical protein